LSEKLWQRNTLAHSDGMPSRFSSFFYKEVIPTGYSDDGNLMTATTQDIELSHVAFYYHQAINHRQPVRLAIGLYRYHSVLVIVPSFFSVILLLLFFLLSKKQYFYEN